MQSGSLPYSRNPRTTDLDLQQTDMETMFENRRAWKDFPLLPVFGKRNDTTTGNSPQFSHPPGHSVRTLGVYV